MIFGIFVVSIFAIYMFIQSPLVKFGDKGYFNNQKKKKEKVEDDEENGRYRGSNENRYSAPS